MNPMTESNRSASSTLVRDVIALGKKYAGAGFPNPNRVGCPNSSTLRAMAYRVRRLRLQDIPASHIVRCSRCFQEYEEFRRIALIIRRIQITAASLAVAAMIFLTALFAWNHAHRSGEPSLAAIPRTPHIAPFPLKVDLAYFSPLVATLTTTPRRKYIFHRDCSELTSFCLLGWNPATMRFDCRTPREPCSSTSGRLGD